MSLKAEEVLLMGTSMFRSARRLRFFWMALSVATITTLLLVACGGGGTTPGPTATSQPTTTSQPTATATATTVKVQIIEQNGKYSFSPAALTITKGTTVEWTNMSDAPHTVTGDTNAFSTTSNLTQNQTFMFTFNTAGTFAYHCNIHTYMKATITVTA
jgi:plastocyanin